MINDKTDEVIEELFQSLIENYQIWLEKSMRGTELIIIVFVYCIIYVIKYIWILVDHI